MIGPRLKLARENLGLTLEAVAERTQLGLSSLSEFENARREPKLSQLQTLATVYGRSISFFLEDAPPVTDVVLWRDRPEQAKAVEVETSFLRLCEQYRNLETWCDERIECILPEAPRMAATSFTYADAEGLASAFRNLFNLGNRPAFGLRQVLEEKCGVKLFFLDFEPSGAAACTVSERFGKAVLLNSKNRHWRRNFDLAHELFHLLTWSIFRAGAAGDVTPTVPEEKFANAFASSLLMPEEAVKQALSEATRLGGALRHSDFFDVARQFDVSVEALLWRIRFPYRRSKEETQRDIDACHALAPLYEERTDEPVPTRPPRFRALALRALYRGEISIGRTAEYLGISRREASELAEREEIRDEEVSLGPA